MTQATLYADGGSRGNPGPAGAGACLVDKSGQILAQAKKKLPPTTNNVAEYQSLILGLEAAQKIGIQELQILMDSQLIVRQIQGAYRVKQSHLQVLYQQALKLLASFDSYSIDHIPRAQNQIADQLANEAMDQG